MREFFISHTPFIMQTNVNIKLGNIKYKSIYAYIKMTPLFSLLSLSISSCSLERVSWCWACRNVMLFCSCASRLDVVFTSRGEDGADMIRLLDNFADCVNFIPLSLLIGVGFALWFLLVGTTGSFAILLRTFRLSSELLDHEGRLINGGSLDISQ